MINNEDIRKDNSIIQFIKELIMRIINHDITATAAFLAYNLMLSFIPFLMFLFTLIGFSNLNQQEVLDWLSYIIPKSSFALIESTVVEVLKVQGSGVVWITIILAIWTASNGFGAVMRGLNRAYGVSEKRGYISRTIRAMVTTVFLALVIILTMILLVFGDIIKNLIGTHINVTPVVIVIWDVIRYFILISILILFFAVLYHFTPDKKLGWIQVLPGAILTTLGWIIISSGFAFYVNNFSNYSRLYGSLGAMFILMTWIYLTSFILLLGGEVNALLSEMDLEDEKNNSNEKKINI